MVVANMPKRQKNDIFRFKQFSVEHALCGMKVSTEACILGAWAPPPATAPRHILDIGTGSGLLALMLAQRFPEALVHAVELEENACRQARLNFSRSPFASRICLFEQQDVLQWNAPCLYDLIVVNPPFFASSMRPQEQRKQLATHGVESLPPQKLAARSQQLLAPQGQLVVLYPPHEMQQFEQYAKKVGLHAIQQMQIYHSEKHPLFRLITVFSKQAQQIKRIETLYIRQANQIDYHPSYTQLLRPFYVIF